MKSACLALASVILTAAPGTMRAQKTDSLMRIIRARYDRITDGTPHYLQYETSLDSLGLEHWANGRGRMVASFQGDTLRTIVATYAGSNGHATETYYFWDGAPIEIRARAHTEGDGNPSPQTSPEIRFYFNHGYLVRWVDPGHTIRPVTTGAVFARAMQLLADATRLVDGARRARDHMATPAAPVDIAEAMRRELRGLVAAESTYYTTRSKYSRDVIAVGYHPTPSVQITLLDATDRGWAARATTAKLPGKSCVVYLGRPKKAPKTAADHAHPDSARVVACDHP